MSTIEQEIADWSATRPQWQQVALRRVAEGGSYTPEELAQIAADLTAGTSTKNVSPLKGSEIPGVGPASGTVSLRALSDLANVNALVDEQTLTFAPAGLTVVYGDNGSGKSGYARLIKAVVGARHQAPIHSNVFGVAGGMQRAEIRYTVDADDRESVWPSSINEELRAVSFYDERCGDTYIGGDSELSYRPSSLALLDGLIAICDAVRALLDEDVRTNQASKGSLPAAPSGTEASKFLAKLSGSTSDAEIDAVCIVAPDAEEQLGALILEEARLRATHPAAERLRLEEVASKIETISQHLSAVNAELDDAAVDDGRSLTTNATEKRVAATMASSKSFDSEAIPGVGSTTWRALWQAARDFSEAEAYHEDEFPVATPGARCVLCHQELTEDAADRLTRFEAFLRDKTAQEATEAERLLKVRTEAVRVLMPANAAIADHVLQLKSDEPALAERISGWLADAGARQTALLELLGGTDAAIPALAIAPVTELDALAVKLKSDAAAIDSTQFQATLDETTRRKEDLEGRLAIAEHRSDVTSEIKRLAKREALEAAKRLTDTTGITRKASELSETYVTSLVRDRFTRESDRLRLERIELRKTGGQKGKLRHRPSLLGARDPKPVPEVLSEGEQTALGLAGFFTEAFFDAGKSALVLDDPVTSLDHVRRSAVARRLAQFAEDRQVIIFTHDVVFVGDLRTAADEEGVEVAERGIQRRGDKVPGLCIDEHPWKAKDVSSRFQALTQELARIKRERANWTQEEYEKECSDWAGKLSETWERLINVEIIHSVVDHGTSEVRPKMFRLLARISEDDNREFQQSYGRCSGWARRHDKSPRTNYVAPEPGELEHELGFVRTWYDRVRKYKN